MQRFIEEQNIALFQRLLFEETSASKRDTLQSLLVQSRRRLALIESASNGALPSNWTSRKSLLSESAPKLTTRFHQEFEMASTPSLLIDPRPGLHIVDANKLYASAAMIDPGKVAGERMFEIFPDNPDDASANGVANLYASLSTVAQTGRTHEMAVQRYDVRDAHGNFVKRYWKPVNSPVLNDAGNLSFILHQVIDVTAQFAGRRLDAV